jgi:hypothetical protein
MGDEKRKSAGNRGFIDRCVIEHEKHLARRRVCGCPGLDALFQDQGK